MGLHAAIRKHFTVAREIGDEFIISCPSPDHDDNNPSASINAIKGVWICYSCGEHGRVSDLIDGLEDRDHTDDLIASLQREVKSLIKQEQHYYPERWLDQFLGAPHPYWLKRGFTEDTITEFQLGYDFSFQPVPTEPPVEMVTTPLRAPNGGLLGVVRRRLDNGIPRYHYPAHADVSTCLFGYERFMSSLNASRHVVLTEGALDAIALWQEGIPAMAQYGDRLSEAQSGLLRRLDPLTLTLAYDEDSAGLRASQRVLEGERRYDSRGNLRLATPPPDLGPVAIYEARWDTEEGKDILDLAPERRREVIEQAQLRT